MPMDYKVTKSTTANRQGNGPQGVSLGTGMAEKAKTAIQDHNTKTSTTIADIMRESGMNRNKSK